MICDTCHQDKWDTDFNIKDLGKHSRYSTCKDCFINIVRPAMTMERWRKKHACDLPNTPPIAPIADDRFGIDSLPSATDH